MEPFIEVQTYGVVTKVVGILIGSCMTMLLWRFTTKKKYLLLTIPYWLLLSYFLVLKLETRVDEIGIHYIMRPVQWKEHTILWQEVDRIYFKNYVLQNWRTQKWDVYSIADADGMYIVPKEYRGKAIIIGTEKPIELRKSIRYFYPH